MTLADRLWNPAAPTDASPAASAFAVWVPGDPIPGKGDWLLIGVASWSRYDHRLLALLESLPAMPGRIAMFNADRCNSQEAVRDFIPQIGFVHHTPIVGLWRDGTFFEAENGYAGRHLIYRVLGLDPKQADEYVLQRPTGAAV
jgi:hypothetical protein